jgi:hypothetical protein
MTLVGGDLFLATPGHRESTRWVVGGVPDGGLIPKNDYWILAPSGVMGNFIGDSPLEKDHLAKARYVGVVRDARGKKFNIKHFAIITAAAVDKKAPLFVILGTSAEIGKTTAAITVLKTLQLKGRSTLVALKATGTSSFSEIARYQDFGATHVFDCIDFGLPTTYPSDREGIEQFFDCALDHCLSMDSDGVVVECGGDLLGANVPVFLDRLKSKRVGFKVILVAPDALAVLGAKSVLQDMSVSIDMVTGPCTDTPTLRDRTQALCKIPAVNMMGQVGRELPF